MKTDAGVVKVTKDDRDCSSAVCEAWELALAGTAYDGLITRYNWTVGMREMFVGSGLFSWKPMSFNAFRGEIYLDEENHTAMCIRNDETADLLGDAACLVMVALFIPLVPVFKAFERGKRAAKGE